MTLLQAMAMEGVLVRWLAIDVSIDVLVCGTTHVVDDRAKPSRGVGALSSRVMKLTMPSRICLPPTSSTTCLACARQRGAC